MLYLLLDLHFSAVLAGDLPHNGHCCRNQGLRPQRRIWRRWIWPRRRLRTRGRIWPWRRFRPWWQVWKVPRIVTNNSSCTRHKFFKPARTRAPEMPANKEQYKGLKFCGNKIPLPWSVCIQNMAFFITLFSTHFLITEL